jgi:hypothetical protein
MYLLKLTVNPDWSVTCDIVPVDVLILVCRQQLKGFRNVTIVKELEILLRILMI